MAVEGERLSPAGLMISGILVLAVGAFCLRGLQGHPVPPLTVAILAFGAFVLQATAAELPRGQLFSSAPALSLAAATLGGNGAGVACLISLSALGLRALFRRPRDFLYTLQANLADAVPELVTICVIARGGGWAGCLAYPPLAVGWSYFMSRGPIGLQLLGPYSAVACVALVGASLDLAAGPWRLAPLVVVLAVLQQRLPAAPAAVGRRPRGWSLPRQAPPGPPPKTPAQLALESLAQGLAVCRNQAGVLDSVLRAVSIVCPSRSQVIFLLHEGRLLPARYQSPLQDRLAGYALLDLPEPVVELAWRTGANVTFPPRPAGPRLFEGEEAGAALLLEQEGVLYMGRSQPTLTEDELRALELIATRAVATLRVVRSQDSERHALEQYQREHERLQQELQRLQSLLEGTRQMASTLDFIALGERLEAMLRASIPHDFGAIVTVSQGQLHLRRQWGAQLNVPAALAMCQAVMANEIPFILERGSRLTPLASAQTGLVAAPMQLEQGTTGVLLVGSTSGVVFEREHQDLLWMIGCLSAISFSNASLHQEVVSTQAQLVHAGKLAAIGQLAAGVAHELNTPLGAIQLAVDGLIRQLKEPDAPAQRKLERARLATNQAREIVDKLLVYSRRDDTEKADHEPLEVSLVVTQTLELVQAQLKRDGVQLDVEMAPLPPVLGSSLELRQVLTNLLMNARDAALSPGATGSGVKIRAHRQEGWVLVQVLDQGPGVDPDLEKRIFEPFFTTKPVGRGTGLGLSISHRIAAQHGGTLEYEPLAGGGACFTLRLPALT